jgi:hypothetical protein
MSRESFSAEISGSGALVNDGAGEITPACLSRRREMIDPAEFRCTGKPASPRENAGQELHRPQGNHLQWR